MSASPTSTVSARRQTSLARPWLATALLIAAAGVCGPALAQDMTVSISDSPDPVDAGAALQYTVTAANLDTTTAATGVVVTVNLPTDVTGISVNASTAAGWTCTPSGNQVSCPWTGDFGPSTTANIVIDAIAPANPPYVVTDEDTGATPDGSTQAFSGTLAYRSIVPGSATFDATVSSSPMSITDDGSGNLTGTNVTGTLSYATGAWTLTWSTGAPDNASQILASYDYTAITCSASVTADADTTPGNNSASEDTVVVPKADLSITKVAQQGSPLVTVTDVDAGTTYYYKVTVHNAGPSRAQGVSVSDNLPNAVTGAATYSVTGWTCDAAPLGDPFTCTLDADLDAGSDATFTVSVVAPADPSSSTLTNTASVSSATSDDNSANDSTGNVDTTVHPVADLGITKADSADPVDAGASFTYTIVVTNNGPSTAADERVVDTLPAGMSYANSTGSDGGWGCSQSSQTITCDRSQNLAPSGTTTLKLNVTAPNDGGTVSNSATVSSPTTNNDPVSSNDTATEDTVVRWVSDLAVTKTDGVTSVAPGEPITYTITVTNNGPSQVTGATVTDSFDELLGVRWSCEVTSGTGACGAPGGRGDIDTTIDLNKDAVATFTVDAWVAPDATGVVCSSNQCLENNASAAVPTTGSPVWTDPTSSNDTGSDADTVLNRSADLFIDKHNEDVVTGDGLDEVGPGQAFQYVLHVASRGPSTVSGATLADTFPTTLSGHPTLCTMGTEYPCWECFAAPPLTFFEDKHTEDSGGFQGVRATAVSPDGAYVYAVGGTADRVVILERTLTHSHSTTEPIDTYGHLALLVAGGTVNVTGPTGVAVSLDGAHVYVTTSASDGSSGSVVTYTRNSSDGTLASPATVATTYGARAAVVSPDGKNVYVVTSGTSSGSVVKYDRDPSTGTLTNAAALTLAGAAAVAISPDGKFVYVASSTGNSVTPYTRDASDGTLTVGTAITALTGATALALSPNGANLYVAGSNSVHTFDRNASTGALSNKVTITDGDDGGNVDGLGGAAGVAVTADGKLVVVAGSTDNALAVLTRDTGTGALTFAAMVASDTPTPTLAGARGVTATPDGVDVLVSAVGDSALSVFTDTFGAVCPTTNPNTGAAIDSSNSAVTIPANGYLDILVYTKLSPVAVGTLENTATVTAPDGADPDISDNNSTDSDPITLATDLTITKTGSSGTAVPGQTYGYTIVASNQGTQGVTGATVADTFPSISLPTVTAGFTGSITWTCTAANGACCTSGGSPCTGVSSSGAISRLVDLPPGGSVTFTTNGTLDSASTGDLSNTATVDLPSGITELTPSDNTVTHTITVTPTADLSIQKVHLPFDADVSTTLTYTLTANNNGPSTATGEAVTDDFPIYDGSSVIAGFTSGTVSWTCSPTGGGCCTSGGACTISTPVVADALNQDVDLPPGSSVVFTVTGTVQADATAAILHNEADVSATSVTDAVLVNNHASDDVVLKQTMDLAITVDDGATQATPGDSVTYTVQASNAGPSDSILATVVDVLPDDLTDVTWTCSAVSPVPGDLTFLSPANRYLGALDGATAVTSSPDGRSVYVAGHDANAVAVYERETTIGPYFGQLAFQEAEVDGVDDTSDVGLTVAGLVQPSSLALSPDARHLYVTAVDSGDPSKGTVVTFSRDINNGLLSYVETETEGVDDVGDGGPAVSGMAGARGVVVSPDGKHVYVAGGSGNAVAAFSRDNSTGRLSFISSIDTGDEVRGVAISPDGAQVYATSGNSLLAFTRDTNSGLPTYGELTLLDTQTEGSGPVDGIAGGTTVVISPDGAYVYVAGTGDDSIAVFGRAGDGTLSYAGKVTDGDGPTDGIEGVTGLAIAPDGEHLVAAGTADTGGALAVFRRTTASGLLAFQEMHVNGLPPSPDVPVDGLLGVQGVAVTSDGRHVLTASTVDNALDAFERRAPDPNFLFLEAEIDGVDGDGVAGPAPTTDGLFGARSVAVNPGTGGKWVYVAGFGEDALAVFSRDAGKGATPDTRGQHLEFLNVYRDGYAGVTGLTGPAAVLASPDGEHVYVASETANAVAVFHQESDGSLTFIQSLVDGSGGIDGISGAAGLAFDPTGRYLYVAGQYEASIAVFERETSAGPDYGKLTYLGKQVNGTDGVSGLDGVVSLAVTSDGRHLVAVSRVDDALVVFRRNTSLDSTPCGETVAPLCGRLNYLQTIHNGTGGADGLDQALSVAVSPEDPSDNVYVAGANQNALSVFRRDTDPSSATFGRLSFVTVYEEGVDGVDGLTGARSVAVGPTGLYVYVAAEYDNSLTVFERVTDVTNPMYGQLTPFEIRQDGADGVDGLDQAYSVAPSRDGRNVYVAGLGDNAVAAFQRRAGSSCTASGSGNIFDTVDVAYGGTVTYTVTGTLRPGARGVPCPADAGQQCLVNTLNNVTIGTVTNPGVAIIPRLGDIDPNLDNNFDTDDDTLISPRADLQVTKTDSIDTVVAGDSTTYTISVANLGPSNANNDSTWPTPLSTIITDIFTSDFDDATWTCLAVGSGSLDFFHAYFDGDTAPTTLGGASAVAVGPDPDGIGPLTEYVYATAITDGALTMFKRDLSTGALEVLQEIHNGDALPSGTVTGLRGASDVAVNTVSASPVEVYVYVASQVDDSLVVFRLVPSTDLNHLDNATLDLVEVHTGLDEAMSVAVSPAGDTVYVASANDDTVRAFSVGGGGGLTLVDTETDGIDDASDAGGPVDGLDGASAVLVSPDGQNVYVAGANDGAVAVFQRDDTDGTLSFLEVKGAASSAGLHGARALALDPTGSYLYVAGGADNAVVVLRRTTTAGPDLGRLIPLAPAAVYVDGVNGIAGIRAPRDILVSADSLHVYVAGQGSDSIVLFNRDAATGRLTELELRRNGAGSVEGLNGVASLALSPDGTALYSAALADSAVAVFGRPADSSCPASGTGDLNVPINIAAHGSVTFTVTAHVRAGSTGAPCPTDATKACVSNTASVAATVDGDTGNNSATDIDFLRRTADLAITKSDSYVEYDGLADPLGIALSPSGTSLYVAGAADSAVGIFQRAPATGLLTFRAAVRNGENGVSGLGGASGVAVSPGGRSVYVTGPGDNSLVAFSRETTAGANLGKLTFLEKETNGEAGAAGLLGARGVVVSPDGEHVYVTGRNSNAVAVFARTTEGDDLGRLVFQQLVVNGAASVVGLVGPTALVISADGTTVYVAAPGSNSVVALSRNTDSESGSFGNLSFLQRVQDNTSGVDGLGGVTALALSPDGTSLYAAGRSDNKVAVFSRNASTGWLTAGSPVDAPGAAGVRVSPAGAHVYVTDAIGNAVNVFSRDPGTGALTLHGTVTDGDVQGSSPNEVVVQGLTGATALAVSPDGAHVYVTSVGDDAVVAFERNTSVSPPEDYGQLGYLAEYLDGGGGAAPGDPAGVTYIIIVTNDGPSDVAGARVQDAFPTTFEGIAWSCATEGGASCVVGPQTGDIDELVDLPAGGRVTFTATGVVRAGATGYLINTATVQEPAGVIDPDPDNNSATDDDTVLSPVADLWVVKDNGLASLIPGAEATYIVAVTNDGPSIAPGNIIYDPMPEAFTDVTWSCVAVPPPGLLSEFVPQQGAGMDAVSASAVSNDGRFVIAVGASGGVGAVVVYPRDTRDGTLGTPVQTLLDGDVQHPDPEDPGLTVVVDGISGAVDVLVSPDDDFVYVAGTGDDAIAVFERDTTTGELTFKSLVRDGVGAVNGIGDIAAIAMSSDGQYLYAAGTADNAVATFGRSATTGDLTFVQFLQHGSLLAPSDIAVTPDGAYVLVSGAASNSVVVFNRNAGTGELTAALAVVEGAVQTPDPSDPGTTVTVEGLTGPVALTVSPDGSRVYVAGAGDNAVAAFTRDAGTGALAFDGAVFQDDTQLLDPTDPLTEVTVDGLRSMSDIAMSPDGGQVYVAGDDASDNGAVSVFTWRNAQLTFLAATNDSGGLLGGGHLALPADGHHLYAGGAAPAPLGFARQPGSTCSANGSGILSDGVGLVSGGVARYRVTGTLLPGATGEVTNTAVVTPGRTVRDPDLVNNTDSDTDPIMLQADLAITKDDGVTEATAGEWLTYDIVVTNNGTGDVRGLTVDDNPPLFTNPGDAGFVAGSLSWTCSAPTVLGLLQTIIGPDPGAAALTGTRWTAVSPDGKHVYATGRGADAITIFERDTNPVSVTFGQLTLVDIVSDGDTLPGGVVSGLAGSAGVAVSPDGAHVYVAGSTAAAIVAFTRDPDTGELDFVGSVADDGATISGLAGAAGVAVSPDGATVYVASMDEDAVAVLQRDADTGELTFLERKRDGFGAVPLNSLADARSVVVTPDGRFVYVAAQGSDAISIFARDTTTGALTFSEVLHQGDLQGPAGDQIQVAGLTFVRSLALSPGGTHLYAASLVEDSVAVFAVDPVSGRLAFVEQQVNGADGVSGIDGATAVAVSPDGSRLYALGLNSNAVAVFDRDWDTGKLRFLEQLALDAPSPLEGAAGLAISPDGQQLYVVSQTASSMVVLGRTADGVCAADGSTSDSLHITLDLEAGASATFTVTGKIHPSARGTLENSATVTPPGDVTDPVPGNNTAMDNDTAIQVVNSLAVTKTDHADSVVAGTTTTYTIVVSNAGPSDALAAQVDDLMPTQLLSPVWTCTASSGSSCTAGDSGDISDAVDVLVDGTLTYTVSGLVDPSFVGTMTNTAAVTPPIGASDPDVPDNNIAVDADAVVPVTNVSVSKSNGIDAVIPGTGVTYTIAVSNSGPSTAVGTVKDTPPSQLVGVTVTWSCTHSPGAVCTAFGSGAINDSVVIPPAGNVTYTLTGTVDPSVLGTIANTASMQLANGYTDPNPANNVASDTDPLTPLADLSIAKVDDADPVVSNDTLTYTITVTNAGPSDARDVVATDSLPAGVTFASTTGCAEDPAGVPTCTLGIIAAGTQKQYTVAVVIDSTTQGALLNAASVAASTTDPDTNNNATTEDTGVLGRVDLTVTKSDRDDPVEAGQAVIYDLTVTNAGPQTARDVVLTDGLPAELEGTDITGCVSGDWTSCNLGDMASGDSRQLVLTTTAKSDAWGTVSNHADVTTTDHDTNVADNSVDEETTIIGVADLGITKDDGTDGVSSGDTPSYIIVVTNAGPGTPTTVDVTDVLPAEFINATWTCADNGGAVCGVASGVDDIVDSPYLPVGGDVTYTLDVTVDPSVDPLPAILLNTATVTVPSEFVDHDLTNNVAIDADIVNLIFMDGFESGDTTLWSGAAGVLLLSAQDSPVDEQAQLPLTTFDRSTSSGASSHLNPNTTAFRTLDEALSSVLIRLGLTARTITTQGVNRATLLP